jgi:hypothetical protein
MRRSEVFMMLNRSLLLSPVFQNRIPEDSAFRLHQGTLHENAVVKAVFAALLLSCIYRKWPGVVAAAAVNVQVGEAELVLQLPMLEPAVPTAVESRRFMVSVPG